MEAMPTPMPPVILAMISHDKLLNKEHPIADNKNNIAAMTRGIFLPMLSLKEPANATPATHPARAEETKKPTSAADKLNCFSTNGITPDITAISNPNSKPPKEATITISKRKRKPGVFCKLNFLNKSLNN